MYLYFGCWEKDTQSDRLYHINWFYPILFVSVPSQDVDYIDFLTFGMNERCKNYFLIYVLTINKYFYKHVALYTGPDYPIG
jgi:hypothetical protein